MQADVPVCNRLPIYARLHGQSICSMQCMNYIHSKFITAFSNKTTCSMTYHFSSVICVPNKCPQKKETKFRMSCIISRPVFESKGQGHKVTHLSDAKRVVTSGRSLSHMQLKLEACVVDVKWHMQ